MEIFSGYAAGSNTIKRPNAVVITVAVDVGLTIQEEFTMLLVLPDAEPRKIVAQRRHRDEGGPPVP